MSETVTDTAPQGGAPEAELAETTAPVGTGAADTTTETTATEDPKPSRADRRIAALSARLAAQAQELDALRRSQQPAPQPQALPQTPEELERLIDARAEAKANQQATQARADAFHEAGRAAHADWNDRCTSLIQMGADAQFSQLLVEMPEGARVAGALADDPEELERIAAIKTERGRAIALGKYAAKLPEEKPQAAPRRAVSRAPAPIRPVNGTANPTFNEYTTDDASALAQHYMRESMERRMRRN